LSELDGLLTQVLAIRDLLTNVICAGHSPLRNLALNNEFDVKLVVDFKAAVDDFCSVLSDDATELAVGIVLFVSFVVGVVNTLLAHFFHGFGLLQLLRALVLLPLLQTDVAEENGAQDVDIGAKVFVEHFVFVLVTDDGQEDREEQRLHQNDW